MNCFAAVKDVIRNMLNNKACFALATVAAVFSLLCFVVFIVAAARKHHKRGAAQVLFLIFGSLFNIAFILTLALSVIIAFNPFDLLKYVLKLEEFIAKIFGSTRIYAVNSAVAMLGIVGVVLFAVAVVLSLAAMITVSVKTKKIKKTDEPASNAESATVTENPAEDAVNAADEPQETAEEIETAEEPSRETETADEPIQSDTQTAEESNREIKNIVNEIDALVTGEAQNDDSDVGEKLKQAILEGYALSDAYLDPENIPSESTEYDLNSQEEVYAQESEPETESEEIESEENGYDGTDADESYVDNQAQSEESYEDGTDAEEPEYEDYAFYNDEQARNEADEPVSYEADEPRQDIAETEPQAAVGQPVKVTPQHVAAPDPRVQTRVRTIIRRPTARNADELIERAASANGATDKPTAPQEAKPQPPVAAQQTKPKSTAPKKQTKNSGTTAKKPVKKQTAKPEPVHEVQAQAQNLPITRKYIILNRRNAAAVFNEYLNGKKEQEKKKITDNLNTVIIK